MESDHVVRLTISGDSEEELQVTVPEEKQKATMEDHTAQIRSMVRTIFNLDLDLSGFYALLRNKGRLSWVREQGAGRLLRAPTVWEDLAKTLLTTNTTWAMTRQMVRRLVSLGPVDCHGNHAFPGPEEVVSLGQDAFSSHVQAGYRSPYLYELAQKIADGSIQVEQWANGEFPSDELYRKITGLKGFGSYAAGAVMKLLGYYDRLAIDSSARSMCAQSSGSDASPADRDIRERYREYGDWQGLALWMDLLEYYRQRETLQ